MTDWLAGWSCRKSHLITASVGAGTNYQVGIKVYKTTGTDGTEVVNGVTFGKVYVGSNCRDDFGDIRFTDDDGFTELDYWQDPDYLVSGTSSVFWVEVKDTLESDATICVYYNNAAQTTTSNFTNTMLIPQLITFTVRGSWQPYNYNIQTTPENALVADNNYGYMTTTDLWSAQDEGCDWVWDSGTTATRTFVRWKANATKNGSYALSFVITLQSSTDKSVWDTKTTYTFTATGSKAVATTAMGTGYRYFRVDQWSGTSVLVTDGQTHVDSVYASKYVSPEPAHSTWGDENCTGAPSITPPVLPPYKSKYMRVTINDGTDHTIGCVNLTNLECSHAGGVESKYGQDVGAPIKPWNRHSIGMERCRFTVQRWYKADTEGDTNLLYDLHNNDTTFDLSEFLNCITGFAGLKLVDCQSYQYRALTDSANDIIGEEVVGEGIVCEEETT